MPFPKDIPIETHTSSGESEKAIEACQRKQRKCSKNGLANSVSQIPRASSLQRPLTSTVTDPPLEINKFKEPPKLLLPRRVFRKSLSQMDMKQSRKSHSRFLRACNFQDVDCITLPKPIPIKKTPHRDGFAPTKDTSMMYAVDEPDAGGPEAKAAGMKIFATIMLNAWRKRRDDVKRLNDEVEQLQRKSIKVKNQIHVLNSVFRNEQKQNDKLHRQIRHATDECQRLHASVEGLTKSLISAKSEAALFEQQLHAKEAENDTLNNILTDSNSQLFKAMTQIRHLQASLSCEQRNLQQLENQKNELLNEITLNKINFQKIEEKHLVEIYQKDGELSKLQSEIKMLETLLMDLKEKEFQVRDMRKTEQKLRNEIGMLKSEVKSLKMDLDRTVSARVRHFWRNCVDLHWNTLLLLHIGTFYLLPAVPPPRTTKLPITISLAKVISITLNKINFQKIEEKHLVEIYQKDGELSKLQSEIKMLETLLMDLKEKEFQVRDMRKTEQKLRNEIGMLKSEVKSLKMDLDRTVSARVRHFWRNCVDLHWNTLLLLHIGTFYLLPAVPPPRTTKLPITISLAKVISVIHLDAK